MTSLSTEIKHPWSEQWFHNHTIPFSSTNHNGSYKALSININSSDNRENKRELISSLFLVVLEIFHNIKCDYLNNYEIYQILSKEQLRSKESLGNLTITTDIIDVVELPKKSSSWSDGQIVSQSFYVPIVDENGESVTSCFQMKFVVPLCYSRAKLDNFEKSVNEYMSGISLREFTNGHHVIENLKGFVVFHIRNEMDADELKAFGPMENDEFLKKHDFEVQGTFYDVISELPKKTTPSNSELASILATPSIVDNNADISPVIIPREITRLPSRSAKTSKPLNRPNVLLVRSQSLPSSSTLICHSTSSTSLAALSIDLPLPKQCFLESGSVTESESRRDGC